MRWVSHASIFFPHQSAVPDLCGPDGGPDGGLRLDHHSGGPGALYHADLCRFCGLGPLRGKRGTLAVVVYLLLGLVGLPVFAGFSSGAAALLGPTGGFLLGFLASALVYWG